MWNIYVPKLFPAPGLVGVWKKIDLPNSLALSSSMSPLPLHSLCRTLKKKILTTPNMSQGIIKIPHLSKKLRRKMLLFSRSHCYDRRSFSARISLNRQEFTKTETLLKPHLSRMTVVVWLMASSTSSLRKEVSGPTRISQSWSRDQKSGKINPFHSPQLLSTKLSTNKHRSEPVSRG